MELASRFHRVTRTTCVHRAYIVQALILQLGNNALTGTLPPSWSSLTQTRNLRIGRWE